MRMAPTTRSAANADLVQLASDDPAAPGRMRRSESPSTPVTSERVLQLAVPWILPPNEWQSGSPGVADAAGAGSGSPGVTVKDGVGLGTGEEPRHAASAAIAATGKKRAPRSVRSIGCAWSHGIAPRSKPSRPAGGADNRGG